MRNWKMEVFAGSWAGNACVYATEQEAIDAGKELLSRWYIPTTSRAVATSDLVNYTFTNGQSLPITTEKD